jgi:NAD(P)-dependent dehydrogenase (short-subunit alcohol dehydrogenase family)
MVEMMTFLITGSNRGLGLELTREGVKRGVRIIATCRKPGPELLELHDRYKELVAIEKMDVSHTASVTDAARRIQAGYKELNGIINNAAILFGSKYDTSDPITNADLWQYEEVFNTNFLGVIRVLKYFIPLIYECKGNRCIINVSTAGAVLSDSGHHYISYLASKSAMNHYTQQIRNYISTQEDKKNIRIYMLHPGQMNTIMGAENAQIEPSEAAKGIWNIVLDTHELPQTIPFYDYNGRMIFCDESSLLTNEK